MCAWVCCVGLQSLSPSLPSLASVPPLMDDGNKGSLCCPPPKESKQTGTKPFRAGAAVRLLQVGWAVQPEVCLKHGCAHVSWEEHRGYRTQRKAPRTHRKAAFLQQKSPRLCLSGLPLCGVPPGQVSSSLRCSEGCSQGLGLPKSP